MAGGIDWFRWHHGSVNDPKFQLVARKSGASVPDVLAVWAAILEAASQAADRGTFDIDCEAIDCAFGFPDARTADILRAMQERGLVDGAAVVSWTKRQPKREREGDLSTERVKAFRERKSDGNAMERQETPRGEESREEGSEAKASAGADAPPPKAKKARSPEDVAKAELWKAAVSVLADGGCANEAQARTFMGKLVGDYTIEAVRQAVAAAVTAQPADAREYLKATCQRLKGERKDPITVPSDAADKTAAELAKRDAEWKAAPPDRQRIAEMAEKARQAVTAGQLKPRRVA